MVTTIMMVAETACSLQERKGRSGRSRLGAGDETGQRERERLTLLGALPGVWLFPSPRPQGTPANTRYQRAVTHYRFSSLLVYLCCCVYARVRARIVKRGSERAKERRREEASPREMSISGQAAKQGRYCGRTAGDRVACGPYVYIQMCVCVCPEGHTRRSGAVVPQRI